MSSSLVSSDFHINHFAGTGIFFISYLFVLTNKKLVPLEIILDWPPWYIMVGNCFLLFSQVLVGASAFLRYAWLWHKQCMFFSFLNHCHWYESSCGIWISGRWLGLQLKKGFHFRETARFSLKYICISVRRWRKLTTYHFMEEFNHS